MYLLSRMGYSSYSIIEEEEEALVFGFDKMARLVIRKCQIRALFSTSRSDTITIDNKTDR